MNKLAISVPVCLKCGFVPDAVSVCQMPFSTVAIPRIRDGPFLIRITKSLISGSAHAVILASALGKLQSRPWLRRQRASRCLRLSSVDGGAVGQELSAQGDPGQLDLEVLMVRLQGLWEDDVGNTVTIVGNEAHFSDGSGTWQVAKTKTGGLVLRGTQFVGTPDEPQWRFPNGVVRCWARPAIVPPEQEIWADVFRSYKDQQMQLRRRVWASVIAEDFDEAGELQTAWAEGGNSIPLGGSLEQQARLHAGRLLVPGVCFVHRRYGYRGVIIACEPWCAATAVWRGAMGVANLPRGEQQPFYHCLVDTRDRPGGQTTFVGEENLEPSAQAFPVQHPGVASLLIHCDELLGYLPSPSLDDRLRQQRSSGNFVL